MPWQTHVKKIILDAYFDSITLNIQLLKSTYTHDPDHDFLDNAGSDDPVDHECTATNQVRKTVVLGTGGWVIDDANNIVTFDIADITWSTLGGATNNTLDQVWIANDAGGADTARVLLAVIPFSAHTTDGNDFTLNITELMRGSNG